MTHWLKFRALARRAVSQWGLAGRQAALAKRVRKEFYDSLWRNAAEELGADVEALDDDILEIRRSGAVTRVCQNYTELDDPVSLRVAGRKPLVTHLLAARGLPVSAGLPFSLGNLAAAEQFLRQQGRCVVKPASGTGGGQGVTTGIETPRQLRGAAISAAGFGSSLLIERQYPGRNLRLLFLDGQLLDAVERQPPCVCGDGRSTIGRLIQEQNRRRLSLGHALAQTVLHIDDDLRRTLAVQRLHLRSVLPAGTQVIVKTAINDNTTEENRPATEDLHPDVIATARQAAEIIGLRLAGVDVLTPDPSRPLEDVGGVILEVNSTPGFHCHTAQAGFAARVAVPVLDACLQSAAQRSVRPLMERVATCP
jgi:cyanophycin synthetase